MIMRTELVPGQSGSNEPWILIPVLINLHLHQALLRRTKRVDNFLMDSPQARRGLKGHGGRVRAVPRAAAHTSLQHVGE